jgi:hypothetical protein
MSYPSFVVGDRVCMRNPALYASNTNGTVTMVFHSATGYYDVKFDAALELRVCYAADIEHSPEAVTLKALSWTDDAGTHHVAPDMRTLPPLLQLGVKRMVAVIAESPAAQQEQATEAVNTLLCVLLTRLAHDEIDRRSYGDKRCFVVRWCDHQQIPFAVSA